MGEQFTDKLLTIEELKDREEEIRTRYREAVVNQFKSIGDNGELITHDTPGILNVGIEIEATFIHATTGYPNPVYEAVRRTMGERKFSAEHLAKSARTNGEKLIVPFTALRERLQKTVLSPADFAHLTTTDPIYQDIINILGLDEVSPELIACHGERKTAIHEVFGLSTTLEDLTIHFDELLSPLAQAARTNNSEIALVGGHPMFNPTDAEGMLSKGLRYRVLQEHLNPFAQEMNIPLTNNSAFATTGAINEGVGTSIQMTIKIPHNFVKAYYDAYNHIGPILMALSASSPFFDGKPTKWNSVRSRLLPLSIYGFSDEDAKQGRPGRWRAITSGNLTKWADKEMFHQLSGIVPPTVAAYYAEIAGDGHLLVSESNIDNSSKPFLTKPTNWPYVQIPCNAGITDLHGIGLEFRMGEMYHNSRDNAAFILTTLAMVHGLVPDLYEEPHIILSRNQVEENIKRASEFKPNNEKKFYWVKEGRVQELPLPEILASVVPKAANALREYGHEEYQTREIINPIISRGGVTYTANDQVNPLSTALRDSPADLLRHTVTRVQPDVTKDAVKISQSAVREIMDPFIYKN